MRTLVTKGLKIERRCKARQPSSESPCAPSNPRAFPDTLNGRLENLVEDDPAGTAFPPQSAHIRAKVEHPFRVIKQQFGFQKTRLRGLNKNQCKVNALAALTNLFMAPHQLLCRT